MPRSDRQTSGLLSRVLVGTDFSPGARAALTRVATLPLSATAEITLLHVVAAGRDSKHRSRGRAETRRSIQHEAAALELRLSAAGHSRVRVRTRIAEGPVVEQLVLHGARMDLMVLGRHGQRSFRDLLVGSTAERVLTGAAVPVLLVVRGVAAPYRRPMVAVDFSDATRRALAFTAGIFAPRAGGLDIVHAYETANGQLLYRAGTAAARGRYVRECRAEAGRAVARRLQETQAAPLVGHVTLQRADPRVAILTAARERRTDLLVLGSRGIAGLRHWLLGSVAEAVMRHADCDVLVVPSGRPSRRQIRSAA